MQGQAVADASAVAALQVEIDRLQGELAARAAEVEQAKQSMKAAQSRALETGEWGWLAGQLAAALRRLVMHPCRARSAALAAQVHTPLTGCPCPADAFALHPAVKKARVTADDTKKELAEVRAQLEAVHAERGQLAAQVAALQAEKQRLQQRIAALEAQLQQSREAAAQAAAQAAQAAKRGPAAREEAQRQVAAIQERAMNEMHQELKKKLAKRKLPEAEAAEAEGQQQQQEQPEAAAEAPAEAAETVQPAKRTRVSPPAQPAAAAQPVPEPVPEPAAEPEAEAAAAEQEAAPSAMEEELEHAEELDQVGGWADGRVGGRAGQGWLVGTALHGAVCICGLAS